MTQCKEVRIIKDCIKVLNNYLDEVSPSEIDGYNKAIDILKDYASDIEDEITSNFWEENEESRFYF